FIAVNTWRNIIYTKNDAIQQGVLQKIGVPIQIVGRAAHGRSEQLGQLLLCERLRQKGPSSRATFRASLPQIQGRGSFERKVFFTTQRFDGCKRMQWTERLSFFDERGTMDLFRQRPACN